MAKHSGMYSSTKRKKELKRKRCGYKTQRIPKRFALKKKKTTRKEKRSDAALSKKKI